MSVIDELERAEGFTETERMLAEYVLEHADEVAHMSLAELAQRTYSSNASVIRLCRKLGVSGFRDFRVELAADIERRRIQQPIRVDADRPFSEGEDAAQVMSALSALLKRAIDDCYASVDPAQVEKAARLIHEARAVWLFGNGDSLISGIAFSNMMIKLGVRVEVANLYNEEFAYAYAAQPDDAALFVSYSGKVAEGAQNRAIIRELERRGCAIVWISSVEGPRSAAVELRFPHRELGGGKIATFYSQMGIRYLLNSLYGAVWALGRADGRDRKARIDDVEVELAFLRSLE